MCLGANRTLLEGEKQCEDPGDPPFLFPKEAANGKESFLSPKPGNRKEEMDNHASQATRPSLAQVPP